MQKSSTQRKPASTKPRRKTMSGRQTVSWVHLSDLHSVTEHDTFQQKKVLSELPLDIQRVCDQFEINLDAMFFTGDASDAMISGQPFHAKFKPAVDLFAAVRDATKIEHFCIVPGNHDVERDQYPPELQFTKSALQQQRFELTAALKKKRHSKAKTAMEQRLKDINAKLAIVDQWVSKGVSIKQWQQLNDVFDGYRKFVEDLQDVFPCLRDQHARGFRDRVLSRYNFESKTGVPVEVAGFNTAWNCWNRSTFQKGHLHIGADWQFKLMADQLGHNTSDKVRVALMHHPSYWSWVSDAPQLDHHMPIDFDFCLHGHEHMSGQYVDPARTFARIAAGACYTHSGIEAFRYNIVEYDLTHHTVHVWMREFTKTGPAWTSHGDFKNKRMSYYLELDKDVYPSRPNDRDINEKDLSGNWDTKIVFYDQARKWDTCTVALHRIAPNRYIGEGHGKMMSGDNDAKQGSVNLYRFTISDVKYDQGSGCLFGVWRNKGNDHHGVFQLDVDKSRKQMAGRFITSEDIRNNEILDHGSWTWEKR